MNSNSAKLHKIMVVEDDKDIATILQFILDEAGFDVQFCESGIEAIEKVESFLPDLILMDVMMPVMDGIQTLDQLKKIKSLSYIPVIFITAKTQEQEILYYKKVGAIDVITKPFDVDKLENQIKAIWNCFNEKKSR